MTLDVAFVHWEEGFKAIRMGTTGAERVMGGRPYPRPPNRPGKVLAHKTAANRASYRQGSSVNSPRRILASISYAVQPSWKAGSRVGV
jgi:hypothetical protein